MSDRLYKQSITVEFEYPVVFARNVFDPASPTLAGVMHATESNRHARAVVFVDSGVSACHPGLADRVGEYFAAHGKQIDLAEAPREVPGGEAIKTDLTFVRDAIDLFVDLELCRHSYVIAIGGGAVLDAVGFAASLFHRGLRLIRLPTTVLAQNDVGVGVKNAMNLSGAKNTVGTFSPPWAVINDFSFLPTLSDEHWINGAAEAFKVAIIRDASFFDSLCTNATRLKAREQEPMEQLIVRCAELHLEHIRTSGDPFEFGRARPLDFGHWSAHRLEAMSDYRISHGQAVATGIALDSCYALRQGWLSEKEFQRICCGLKDCGFALWRPELEKQGLDGRLEVLKGLESFRQHLGGQLYLTFPRGIGRRMEIGEVDEALIAECAEQLKGL